MTLQEIRTYLEIALNKHSSGNTLTPQEFNILLESSIFNFVKSQVLNYRNYVNGVSPLDDVVYTTMMIEALQAQDTPALSSGTFPLPATYLMINNMWGTYNSNYKKIEIVSPEEYAKRVSNHLSKPIAYHPIAFIVGSNCKYFPTNMTAITVDYIAKPTIPKMDYYVDANYNIQYLAASATHLLTAGEYGSAGQTSGTTVTSLTTELDIPEDTHAKFCDYLLSQLALRDRDVNLYQASEDQKNQKS